MKNKIELKNNKVAFFTTFNISTRPQMYVLILQDTLTDVYFNKEQNSEFSECIRFELVTLIVYGR